MAASPPDAPSNGRAISSCSRFEPPYDYSVRCAAASPEHLVCGGVPLHSIGWSCMLLSAATELLAISLVAAILILLPLVGIIISMRRYRVSFVPGFLLGLNRIFNRIRWHTHVNRPMSLAPGQGAVIIANHRSGFDPMFLQMAAPRMIHWMVAKEFCVDHWLAYFFRTVGSIPAGAPASTPLP